MQVICVWRCEKINISGRMEYMSEENVTETKEEKKRQPVNIILGLLIIGLIFYFCWPKSSFLAFVRLIPASVITLTRKNNIFASIVLFIFGLTILFLPTFDAFLLLVSAVYMFFSAVLRMFKVKQFVIIGLVIALILGLWAFKMLTWDKMQTFVPEGSITIVKELDSENGMELVTDMDKVSTMFNAGQVIYPKLKGLKKDTSYAFRIINKSGDVVIPLDKWPVFKTKNDGGVVRGGEFNNGDWLPLNISDYTIQLVKIEEPRGTIVAESNFSIVPYDKQKLSKLTAYLTAGNDSKKYYDSYTVKGSDSVTAWIQSSKEEAISGKVRFFKTNYNGDIEKTAWDRESAFKTNPDGEPVSLGNLSGNPSPGIYHYEIIIDGNVVFHLKHISE